ncbi:MAG: DedA family protein [Burkholderiaceae bacterium]|nr:DedA family protein [Burkholderiaceae bacterium]
MLPEAGTALAAYAALFASAFTSATLLPGSSEAMLLALLAGGHGAPPVLVAVASAGNVLGSLVNWALGRLLSDMRGHRWFPIDERTYRRAASWYQRHGAWSLLLSWLPVVGDPLTVVAGALRVGLLRFLVLVTLGKGARYVFIAGAYLWWRTPPA